jgi:hypothetical protein
LGSRDEGRRRAGVMEAAMKLLGALFFIWGGLGFFFNFAMLSGIFKPEFASAIASIWIGGMI